MNRETMNLVFKMKCFLWVFFVLLSVHGQTVTPNNNKVESQIPVPHNLTVEFIRNTHDVLIHDTLPEYGWIVSQAAKRQSYYQIIVSSSKENIGKNVADVWDSKKVKGNQSSNITHKGVELKQGKTYFWKVRIWGANKKPSEFSKYQSFKIALNPTGITTPNSFRMDSIKPKLAKEISKSSYFIDFGKAAFANMTFEYEAKKNDTITVRIGEQLEGNSINRNPQGTIRYQEIKVQVKPGKHNYILPIKPDKRNTKAGAIILPDSFPVLMPFRYAEIANVTDGFDTKKVIQLAYFGYWEDNESYFKSSDSILNQVWDLCKYSIKATTFAGVYVDGDRERIPYEADAYLNQLSHYTTDREYAMARQTIEYFMENPTWPTEWQLHVALMFYADYMYTGNVELIERYYDQLKFKTLMELRRDDGLISSDSATPEFMKKLGFKDPKAKLKDIVDWPPAQKDTGWKLATEEGERDGFVFKPINTVVNCLYYKNMEIMAQFASILKKSEEADAFELLAIKAKESINNKLFNKEKGYYVDGEGTEHASLHANMMALAFNMVPEEYIKSVADFIKTRGMACSVYGSQYLLEALYNANESNYALALLTATNDRSWYNMIRIGSTITLEAWDMKYKPNSDWNHAWGATPANLIPRGLWGIQPKIPGFKIASIKPQLGTLETSSIVVPTIMGSIKAEYILMNDTHKKYTIEIPSNMLAEFEVGKVSSVILNGKKIKGNSEIIHLKPGKNVVEIKTTN